jgi:hypothetical protein
MQSQIIVDRFLRSNLSHSFKLNAYERILLVILASYAGHKDKCFPSHQSLSIDCGMSTDSVGRYAQLLEEKQLLTINRVTGNNNLYKLSIPMMTPTADSTHRSEQPPADSDNHASLTAASPTAESGTNNISNNIKESTSLLSLKKQKTKSSFPVGMTTTERHKNIAFELGLNIEDEFECFKEHHTANGNKFERWDMAFNMWLRRAAKYSQKKSTTTSDVMIGVGHE